MKKGIFKEQFSNSNERIKELDYLKCVFILLMIIFHLVYIGDKYPYAKQIVYTFHMSAFLIISIYYIIYNLQIKLNNISRFILVGICLFMMSYYLQMMSFSNAIYFMMGIAVYQSKIHFISVFQPAFIAIIPFFILCCFPTNLDRGTLAGVAITYLAINIFLFSHQYLSKKIKNICYFIGRNTLIILVFSPVFTILSKLFIPFFSFDPSGMCFMCTAVIFTVTGCFAIGWFTDKINLSRYCFGKKHIII